MARMVGDPDEDGRKHQDDRHHQRLPGVLGALHRHEAAEDVRESEPLEDDQHREEAHHPDRDLAAAWS